MYSRTLWRRATSPAEDDHVCACTLSSVNSINIHHKPSSTALHHGCTLEMVIEMVHQIISRLAQLTQDRCVPHAEPTHHLWRQYRCGWHMMGQMHGQTPNKWIMLTTIDAARGRNFPTHFSDHFQDAPLVLLSPLYLMWLLHLKQNNLKQFQNKPKTMFCFRRSYMWNKTLKQFQHVLGLFQSCFGLISIFIRSQKICKS